MADSFALSGRLEEVSLPRVLHHLSRESVDGALRVDAAAASVTIHLMNRCIRCLSVHKGVPAIDEWLVERGELSSGDEVEHARKVAHSESIPFGRAMMQLELWDPETFWERETAYQVQHIYGCFDYDQGKYAVITGMDTAPPGVWLDLPLQEAILRGIRAMRNPGIIRRELDGVAALYVRRNHNEVDPGLKPHERHVLELLARESDVEKVLRKSLLPPPYTRRVMFMLLAANKVSTRPLEESVMHQRQSRVVNNGTFNSFEDALKYYNQKYEMIFRVLSKEIGPIALSILQKAVAGIGDNLPGCLRRAQLQAGGGLEAEPVLKAVWYQDFERTIGEFLRGLEEILYAQVYAVKRHLGVEVEQQILKWLNRTEM